MINVRARPCAEGTIRSTAPVAGITLPDKTWALIAAILGTSTAFIDESVVNVALPAIETDLAASAAVIMSVQAWVAHRRSWFRSLTAQHTR